MDEITKKRAVRRDLIFILTSLSAVPAAISTISNYTKLNDIEIVGFLGNLIVNYRKAIQNFGIYLKEQIGITIYIPYEAAFLAVSLTLVYYATIILGRYAFDYQRASEVSEDSWWLAFSILTAFALTLSFGEGNVLSLFVFLYVICGSLLGAAEYKEGWTYFGSSFRSFLAFCLLIVSVLFLVYILYVTLYNLYNHDYSWNDIWIILPVYSFVICLFIIRNNVRALPAIIIAIVGLLMLNAITSFLVRFELPKI